MKEFMDVNIKVLNGWKNALDMARQTVNKDSTGKEPSDKWKKQMLLAEHSPIRELRFLTKLASIPTWISQHIARHDFGGEHHALDNASVQYVATQRTDRTKINRDDLPQTAPVNHSMTANAQDLINMSRKRLCGNASKETREAWEDVKYGISLSEPIMAEAMVPECVYRGFCPEIKCCGFVNTQRYNDQLERYRAKL